jgi:TetR/AcrR family transcriptional regulator, mexJK operon transcriptional repressor
MGTPAETRPRQAAKDERREAIVSIAHEAFLTNGYAGTSMSAIAARLGGSKGTLYNYFSSKEALFEAVIARKCEQFVRALYDAEVEGGDLREALTHAAERIIALALADDTIATHRLVVAECARFPEIGQTIHTAGPMRGREQLRKFLARAKDDGQLRPDADLELAAEQFFVLCISDMQQRRLWMVAAAPSKHQIHQHAEGAVTTFMRAFGA